VFVIQTAAQPNGLLQILRAYAERANAPARGLCLLTSMLFLLSLYRQSISYEM